MRGCSARSNPFDVAATRLVLRRFGPVDARGPAEVELGDLGIVEQLFTPALEPVLTDVEDVTATRHPERPAGVLLDHHEGDALPVDLRDLLEDRLHERWRESGRELVEEEDPRLRHQSPAH